MAESRLQTMDEVLQQLWLEDPDTAEATMDYLEETRGWGL